MTTNTPKFTRQSSPEKSARMLETIVGCKWSMTVYNLLHHGINRPGEMVRNVEGLSTKVLNTCLKRNVEFGILKRVEYPQIPPKVEYHVTELGMQLIEILKQLQSLQEYMNEE